MSLFKESISFVVVCFKSSEALKSLLLSVPKEIEVILVDNSQDEETREIAKAYDCLLLQNKKNIGFGAACNLGASKATGDYLLFVNPDSEILPNALEELIKAAQNYPNASAFNPRIIHMLLYYYIATEKNPSPRSYFYGFGLIATLYLLVDLGIFLIF